MIWILPKKTFSVNGMHMAEGKFQSIPIGMHQWLLLCPNVDDYIDEEDAGLLNMRRAQLDEENRQTQEKEARKKHAQELADQELSKRSKDAIKREEDTAKRMRASKQEKYAKELQDLTARITQSDVSNFICDVNARRKSQHQKRRLETSSVDAILDHEGHGYDPYCDGRSLFRGGTQYGLQMAEGCYRVPARRGC